MTQLVAEQKVLTGTRRSYSLPVMVVLGDPRQANCSNHGICKVYSRQDAPEVCPCMHPANACLSISETGALRFVFEANSMTEETLKKFFLNDLFCVQSDFELDETLKAAFNCTDQIIRVEQGLYPVSRYEGFFEVVF